VEEADGRVEGKDGKGWKKGGRGDQEKEGPEGVILWVQEWRVNEETKEVKRGHVCV
jgi:hypothetical protein